MLMVISRKRMYMVFTVKFFPNFCRFESFIILRWGEGKDNKLLIPVMAFEYIIWAQKK